VKQAATGEYPVGRGPSSRRPTTKEARQVSDDKAKLTEHFIVTLPQLLAKVCAVLCPLQVITLNASNVTTTKCFKAACVLELCFCMQNRRASSSRL